MAISKKEIESFINEIKLETVRKGHHPDTKPRLYPLLIKSRWKPFDKKHYAQAINNLAGSRPRKQNTIQKILKKDSESYL